MLIKIDKEGTLSNLELILKEFALDSSIKSIMVLACDENGFNPSNADSLFRNCSVPVFGGIFPALLTSSEKLSKGTIVAGLPVEAELSLLRNISNSRTNLEQLFSDNYSGKSLADGTIFMFVDGMSQTIAPLLDATFNHLGLRSNYLGGGAGSGSFQPIPCIITPEGILKDAAIFAFTALKSGVGVAHGWHPVSRTLKVTESRNNMVISLDWKPAYSVYRDIVSGESGMNPESVNFEEISGSFPLGILKMADELLVRDPVKCEGSSLICLGEMPLNSFLYILKGDAASLLEGTKKSRERAARVFEPKIDKNTTENCPVVFFIDCITRAGFLKEKFQEELKIASGGCDLIGALSLGEISNSGNDYLEFYNKTCVVGLVEN